MKKLLLLSLAVVLSSCAVQKNWGAAGGSKADGTVKLAYTYGIFEVPKVNSAQALKIATQRCQSWGYKSATPFDFINKKCQQMNSSGCDVTIVEQDYQCE